MLGGVSSSQMVYYICDPMITLNVQSPFLSVLESNWTYTQLENILVAKWFSILECFLIKEKVHVVFIHVSWSVSVVVVVVVLVGWSMVISIISTLRNKSLAFLKGSQCGHSGNTWVLSHSKLEIKNLVKCGKGFREKKKEEKFQSYVARSVNGQKLCSFFLEGLTGNLFWYW